MEKLNYFTGKFSKSELEDHFDSLNEEKLKSELENFINQYLKLSEEEQLKCVELVLYIFSDFEEKIDKIIQKKILESINKILSNNSQVYSWSVCFRYLDSLYYYLFEPKEYEEYSILFENESYFFKIIDLVLKDNLENSKMIYSDLLSVFVPLFRQKSLPEERRNYFKSELEPFINFIFENIDFENIDFENIDFNYTRYWYFRLDELVSIFQFEHLKIINKYFIDNPQAEDIDDYLDFVSRHFDVVINDSIDVVRKIAEENNSDIIRDQAIKLIEKYDNAYSNEKSYSESISSLDAKQLLKQADNVISYIRSKLTVDAEELKKIGSFGHYTKIDTLTNFLIKADWKNENNSETQPPFLRLTNLKQLNDPMEGRVIYDYLGIDNTFFKQYQTSNVFISSLTTVSDSLPMWKEYADSSQGAFLEYDLSYLEDIVAHKSIEFVKVHYLDLMSENKEETDVGKSLDNLKQLFEKLQELEAEKELISFAEKLKKISYLFKVKDYEYEIEYRILINLDDTAIQNIIKRDANDSSNEKYFKKEEIGLEVFDKVNYKDFRKYIVLSSKDNGRYDLFVYINLLPLKYSKVILGPKVTDADYIAPYLKLANPDIEIESSKIPYR
ncbi:MAG: DUF2971 domain-containing protein [Streptococcus mitis]|uniref:PF11185 family protein n=2 Tax=Streptococcus mitis group TaxID=3409772 RepID=I0SZV7_STRMT|nr:MULTISPECIES: DUF2971 domain-containing protein [Streptococcus]EID28910.1 PF11185 family protein [Streptococcus mitis SK575]MBW7579287.1 DUF2971 domain-containing protein [Streptococcus humanilactis]MBW7581149.1 DUF2971 domain-containing protein [Streptococcus humanilactis]MDU1929259.1 DUF2971 domain-containing protein [Streptococcus mitis]